MQFDGVEANDPLFGGGAAPIDLDRVTARRNLQETAFFLPHLTTNKRGEVRMEFTMPEALTEWRFRGFAHDNALRSGVLTGSAVTSKDLMVQPNPPRFVREGDTLEFTVKVSNQSVTRQEGKVRLTFNDASRTGFQPVSGASSPSKLHGQDARRDRLEACPTHLPTATACTS